MLSIIIPVYNAANVLERCLASLVLQSYSDFIVMLINDGSIDNSGDICDRYVQQDTRFQVIHQKNAGVSAARNVGMDQIKTPFVVFVDSDDWLSKNFLEDLLNDILTQQVDLVDQSFNRVYLDGSSHAECYENNKFEQDNKEVWLEKMMRGHTGPFPKIYKTSIIQDQQLRFDESLHLCEDLVFTLQYMKHASNGIYFSNKLGYHYYQMADSLGNNIQAKDMQVSYQALLELLIILSDSFYAPLLVQRDRPIYVRHKIIQLSMFFIASLHNNSKRKDRLVALRTLRTYDLMHYWNYIKVKNPLRKLFFQFFQWNMLTIALCIEDFRYGLQKWGNS